MKIAIDYDDTYTADKNLFNETIRLIKSAGHETVFVTYRDSAFDNKDILKDAELLNMRVIFTNGHQKETHYDADIWIDDKPVTIPSANELKSMFDSCESFGDKG